MPIIYNSMIVWLPPTVTNTNADIKTHSDTFYLYQVSFLQVTPLDALEVAGLGLGMGIPILAHL